MGGTHDPEIPPPPFFLLFITYVNWIFMKDFWKYSNQQLTPET